MKKKDPRGEEKDKIKIQNQLERKLQLKKIIILNIFVFVSLLCTAHKEVKTNENKYDTVPLFIDPRLKPVDLSHSLEEANDTAKFTALKPIIENRNTDSIKKIIVNHVSDMKYEYNKRLKINSKLRGKISLTIKIVSSGKVISCEVYDTKINDIEFIYSIIERIKKWNFGQIQVANDTTTFTCPFVFSQ